MLPDGKPDQSVASAASEPHEALRDEAPEASGERPDQTTLTKIREEDELERELRLAAQALTAGDGMSATGVSSGDAWLRELTATTDERGPTWSPLTTTERPRDNPVD